MGTVSAVDTASVRTLGIAGARRLLTVMFCDLVGSTAMSQQLDPEDYAELVLDYQETGRRVVEEHGGAVAQFAGDGLVIQFGYPVAHENDAERAVDAALSLMAAVAGLSRRSQADFGVELSCRIGIDTGVTVVGRMGAESRSDTSLFGGTANVAARVQAEALPGQVLVTDAVVDLLRGSHDIDDARTVELRGVEQPVGIARVIGVAARPRWSLQVDVVGRGTEQAQLLERWQAAADGRGGAVVVSGDAGIGKSTLVRSLRRAVGSDAWIEVRARELSAFSPFTQLAELAVQLGDDGAPAVRDAARDIIGVVGVATGSAEHGWQLAIEAAARLGQALATCHRLVLIEDLHWLDASSRAALGALVGALVGGRSLVVATTRPPADFGSAPVLVIERLPDDEVAALVRATQPTLADDVLALIVERAAGVPLYAAELARAAAAGGSTGLPDSLQASFLARLDRTIELARPTQIASVLGDEIDPRLFGALLGVGDEERSRLLGEMARAGLVVESNAGRATFAHALLREAIYGSLLQRDRRELHRQAAVALDEMGERETDRVAVVAHHWELAGEPVEAAACFGLGARRTAQRGAFAEALALADRGLALVAGREACAEVELDLTMTRGNVRFAVEGYSAPGIKELWHRAEQLAVTTGNHQEQSSAMNGPSVAALFDGDYATATTEAERVLRFGREHNDRSALIRGYCSLSIPELFVGEVALALDHAREAVALYQPGDDQLLTYGFGTDHGVIAYSTAGMAAWFADEADADDLLTMAIEHAERIESPISLCLALQQAAAIDLAAQRYSVAQQRLTRVEEVGARFGLPFYVGLGQLGRAAAEAWLGNEEALADAGAALTVLLGGLSQLGVTLGLFQLALCQEGCGEIEAALGTARYAVGIAHERGEFIFHAELGHIVARTDRTGEGWAALDALVDAAEQRGAIGSARRARTAAAHRSDTWA